MTTNKGILLETGTNEFEIVEFRVGSVTYGINVAKVREVINQLDVTKMPNAHHYVDGVFTLRGKVIPLVNLARCLGSPEHDGIHKIIVSELNNYLVGFLVDEVTRIHRISWTEMEPPPGIANSEMVVGIVKMADKMVVLLDFERIVSEINPEINEKFHSVPKTTDILQSKRGVKSILVAEDSKMLRDLLVHTMNEAGYVNIDQSDNGLAAWNKLQAAITDGAAVEEKYQLLITDIEMPQMDGHHLLRRVKEHERLKHLPVLIFSSLINEEMRRKGEAMGADGQVSKPEIAQLIDLVDKKIL